jgi:hypothetical protein
MILLKYLLVLQSVLFMNDYRVIDIINHFKEYYMIVLSDSDDVYWFVLSPKNTDKINEFYKPISIGDSIRIDLERVQNISKLEGNFRGEVTFSYIGYNRYITLNDSICVPVFISNELKGLQLHLDSYKMTK